MFHYALFDQSVATILDEQSQEFFCCQSVTLHAIKLPSALLAPLWSMVHRVSCFWFWLAVTNKEGDLLSVIIPTAPNVRGMHKIFSGCCVSQSGPTFLFIHFFICFCGIGGVNNIAKFVSCVQFRMFLIPVHLILLLNLNMTLNHSKLQSRSDVSQEYIGPLRWWGGKYFWEQWGVPGLSGVFCFFYLALPKKQVQCQDSDNTTGYNPKALHGSRMAESLGCEIRLQLLFFSNVAGAEFLFNAKKRKNTHTLFAFGVR